MPLFRLLKIGVLQRQRLELRRRWQEDGVG
ncbi:hypothetical protein A2U01_0099824, partial [Trifolium medium]|nr:hypothetical protein [Trifolium medium]